MILPCPLFCPEMSVARHDSEPIIDLVVINAPSKQVFLQHGDVADLGNADGYRGGNFRAVEIL